MKRTAIDGIVLADSNRNLTSPGGSNSGQAEHQHHRHLRNSTIRSSQISLFSSRLSSSNDEKLRDVTPDVNQPAGDQTTPIRRKRGWPKGVPRKKQVNSFFEMMVLIMAFS